MRPSTEFHCALGGVSGCSERAQIKALGPPKGGLFFCPRQIRIGEANDAHWRGDRIICCSTAWRRQQHVARMERQRNAGTIEQFALSFPDFAARLGKKS